MNWENKWKNKAVTYEETLKCHHIDSGNTFSPDCGLCNMYDVCFLCFLILVCD